MCGDGRQKQAARERGSTREAVLVVFSPAEDGQRLSKPTSFKGLRVVGWKCAYGWSDLGGIMMKCIAIRQR